jgi:hypothetical protein
MALSWMPSAISMRGLRGQSSNTPPAGQQPPPHQPAAFWHSRMWIDGHANAYPTKIKKLIPQAP